MKAKIRKVSYNRTASFEGGNGTILIIMSTLSKYSVYIYIAYRLTLKLQRRLAKLPPWRHVCLVSHSTFVDNYLGT